MPTQDLLLGLDFGTQSVRAALVRLNGQIVAFGTSSLKTTYPKPAWAEQSPDEWWAGVASAVTEALAKSGATASQVRGIGLDTTACTVVACKADGTVLRPALLWMDQRSAVEAEAISATKDPVLKYVSGKVSPEWMLPKALWMKKHEPEIYKSAERIVECTDWMMHKLTGQWTLALNHVAVKWNYAKPEGGWPADLIDRMEIDDIFAKWPKEIVPLGRGNGVLCKKAASHLGLIAGTPVAQGGIDAYLGMLGMGATASGDVAVIVGSSTCHLAQSKTGVFGSGAAGCYPEATVEGLYTLEAGQTATGSILDWFRRHLAFEQTAEAEKRGVPVYQVLDEQAGLVSPGCEGLIARDDWQGNRSPYKNPRARGAWTGLSLAHTPAHMFRSIYEATAFGTRQILEDASAHGLEVNRIFLGGGGAKSALWTQIHADALQKPIHIPAESESCALGSAMAAGMAAGMYVNFDAAAAAMVRMDRVVEPNASLKSVYDGVYSQYVNTYRRLNE
ncbi:MAG: ribulokinase [bacterium]